MCHGPRIARHGYPEKKFRISKKESIAYFSFVEKVTILNPAISYPASKLVGRETRRDGANVSHERLYV
jgi:hypothetical protein